MNITSKHGTYLTGAVRFGWRTVILRGGVAFFLAAALSACGGKSVTPKPDDMAWRPTTVRDLQIFPQNLTPYAIAAGENTLLLEARHSAEEDARFARLFYAAWSLTKPDRENAAFFRAQLARQGERRGFAENLQPWTDERWQQMEVNADMGRFPSMLQPAITVRSTNLRQVPTHRPRYANPEKAGQSFPFDEFQQTSLPAGMPLMAFHRSRDGAWLYVENALVPGWVAASDVALVSPDQREQMMALPRAAFVCDDVPLRTASGQVASYAHIGTVLPLACQRPEALDVLVPLREADGRARLENVRVSREEACPMPLPLTAAGVAAIGNRLMGQPYGWGGLFGNRDCSGMLRDLFTPFGLWLPRNSGAQARAGRFVSLQDLSPEEKQAVIRQEGIPFLTLLWLPGHIGLYVGQHDGEAAFFHNMWGVRTRDDGRHVLGRAVVTSVMPGRELRQADKEALLLHRMKGMAVLGKE